MLVGTDFPNRSKGQNQKLQLLAVFRKKEMVFFCVKQKLVTRPKFDYSCDPC